MPLSTNRRLPHLVALPLAAFMFAPAAQATDGYFLPGVGASAKGTGGVAIALPQDALSIAANPAAATELGHRIDGGFDIFIPRRGASISGNAAGLDGDYDGNGANPFVMPEFGYVRPLSDNVSAGIAIYAHGGMNTSYDQNPFASLGGTGKAGVDLKQVFITPTIATRIAPGHSIGISAIGLVQGFRAHGITPFAAASAQPGNFSDRGTSVAFGGGVQIGYLGRITDRVSIGAFYKSKIWSGKFDKYSGLFAEQGGFDVPASFGGGIAVKASDKLTIAADVKHIQYSDVQSVGNALAPLFQGVPFGADDAPGFGWQDITVGKFGAVYHANDRLTLRAGYSIGGNPVPQSETLLNVLAPGVVKEHFTAGATIKTRSNLELTAYAMHAPRNTVRGEGSIPANFGGGEADIHLSETSFGIAAGFSF